MGTIKALSGFFANLGHGELRANGDRQRVLVQRVANKTVSMIPAQLECPNLPLRNEIRRRGSGETYGTFFLASRSVLTSLAGTKTSHSWLDVQTIDQQCSSSFSMMFILQPCIRQKSVV